MRFVIRQDGVSASTGAVRFEIYPPQDEPEDAVLVGCTIKWYECRYKGTLIFDRFGPPVEDFVDGLKNIVRGTGKCAVHRHNEGMTLEATVKHRQCWLAAKDFVSERCDVHRISDPDGTPYRLIAAPYRPSGWALQAVRIRKTDVSRMLRFFRRVAAEKQKRSERRAMLMEEHNAEAGNEWQEVLTRWRTRRCQQPQGGSQMEP